MAHTNLTEAEARSRIERAGGRASGGVIDTHLRNAQPGLKVLAAIDCLVHYHGYTWAEHLFYDSRMFKRQEAKAAAKLQRLAAVMAG